MTNPSKRVTPVSYTHLETELLTLAAALESRSEHPLAKAVLADAEAKAITPPEVTDFAALPGNGLAAKLDGMDKMCIRDRLRPVLLHR